MNSVRAPSLVSADGEQMIASTCPKCGMFAETSDCGYETCRVCDIVWEAEDRPDPEKQLCNNCAYRKGSPERADPQKWSFVSQLAGAGQKFYCHKRLPLKAPASEILRRISADEDVSAETQPPTLDSTVCAGWLAARRAHYREDPWAAVYDGVEDEI